MSDKHIKTIKSWKRARIITFVYILIVTSFMAYLIWVGDTQNAISTVAISVSLVTLMAALEAATSSVEIAIDQKFMRFSDDELLAMIQNYSAECDRHSAIRLRMMRALQLPD